MQRPQWPGDKAMLRLIICSIKTKKLSALTAYSRAIMLLMERPWPLGVRYKKRAMKNLTGRPMAVDRARTNLFLKNQKKNTVFILWYNEAVVHYCDL
jgi:hypothetical protein